MKQKWSSFEFSSYNKVFKKLFKKVLGLCSNTEIPRFFFSFFFFCEAPQASNKINKRINLPHKSNGPRWSVPKNVKRTLIVTSLADYVIDYVTGALTGFLAAQWALYSHGYRESGWPRPVLRCGRLDCQEIAYRLVARAVQAVELAA